jgi:hypothetical protein
MSKFALVYTKSQHVNTGNMQLDMRPIVWTACWPTWHTFSLTTMNTAMHVGMHAYAQVRALISAILAASHPLLPEFGAPEMSGTLHALAKLRVRPPAAWVSAAMEHTKGVLSEAG